MYLNIHALTAVPAANLNRDDTGRPKVVEMGGAARLRLSSQSLKRALRNSAAFQAFSGRATRSRLFERDITKHLVSECGVAQPAAERAAAAVLAAIVSKKGAKAAAAAKAAKPRKKATQAEVEAEEQDDAGDGEAAAGDDKSGQLLFLSPREIERARDLAKRLAKGEAVTPKADDILLATTAAVDLAMFGRMIANQPAYNVDAAVQVAHAVTTHRSLVQDDYFTAVDELQPRDAEEGGGAGHVSEAGVFYIYASVNVPLLIRNLGGDARLAKRAVAALVRALPVTLPGRHQNSFAAHVPASFMMVERASSPLSLVGAFYRPLAGTDLVTASAEALRRHREEIAAVYGANGDTASFQIGGKGTLADLVALAEQAVPA